VRERERERGLRENDEVASYGSRDSDVADFGEGKKNSLCFNF
jgi:hypothetical protein